MKDYFAGDPRTQRERMIAGDWYISGDLENRRISHRAVELMELYRTAFVQDEETAQSYLKELIGTLGEEVRIKPPLFVDHGQNISIGARTFINYNLTALDIAPITIGADCQIGPNVQLLTPIHPIDVEMRRDKLEAAKPIKLGDNVWLGGGVTVLPGITIGDNSIIGAGSVVTKEIPANVIAVGNPAHILRKIE